MMFLLALLLIFNAVSEISPAAPSKPRNLDWSQCGKADTCAVLDRPDCLTNSALRGPDEELVFGVTESDIDPNCKYGIVIRPIRDDWWSAKMQVRREFIIPAGGFYLNHGGKRLFGCRLEGGKVVAQADKDRKINMYHGDESHLDPGDFFCAFVIDDPEKMIALAPGVTELEYYVPTLIKSRNRLNKFDQIAPKKTCNRLDLRTDELSLGKTIEINDEKFIMKALSLTMDPTAPKTSMLINCRAEPSAALYARYESRGPPPVSYPLQRVRGVICKKDSAGQWVFVIRKSSADVGQFVTKGEKFDAFCAVPVPKEPPLPAIDWEKCGSDAVCAVRDTEDCLKVLEDGKTRTGTNLLFGYTNINSDCRAGIWIRPLNDKVWVVKMQVKTDDIDPVKGMFLNHTGETLFGCTLDGNGTLQPHAGSSKIKLYNFEQSRLKEKDCYCSFLIEDANWISSKPAGKTFMQYVLTTALFDNEPTNEFQKVNQKKRCDMFKANANVDKNFPGFIRYKFEDLVSLHLTCAFLPYSRLFAGYSTLETKAVDSVKCELVMNTQTNLEEWVYNIREKPESALKTVPKDAEFEAFCGVPLEAACPDPKFAGLYPPKFERDTETGKVSLSCGKRKWLITSGTSKFYPAANDEPFCRNSDKHPNKAGWFIKNNGMEVEFTKAECDDDIQCKYATTINTKCPDGMTCPRLLDMDGLRCKVEHRLTVIQRSGKKLTMDKLVCNYKKGVWAVEGDIDTEIDRDANVYCEPIPKEAKASLSPKVTTGISIAAIVIIALAVVYFVIKCHIERR